MVGQPKGEREPKDEKALDKIDVSEFRAAPKRKIKIGKVLGHISATGTKVLISLSSRAKFCNLS